MANGSKKRKRIWVTDEVTRTLCSEFETTHTTVLNSLKGFSHSDLAVSIRTKAIHLMEEVMKSNKELIKEFND